MSKIPVSREYLTDLASEVLGWFVGGALAALALDTLDVAQLGNVDIWKTAAGMGLLGVLKGLAGRFVGDPNTTSLRRH